MHTHMRTCAETRCVDGCSAINMPINVCVDIGAYSRYSIPVCADFLCGVFFALIIIII